MTRNTYQIGTDKYVPESPICVMLDTENPLFYPEYLTLPIFQDESVLYKDFHVTLRYGILPHIPYQEIKSLVLDYYSTHNVLEVQRGPMMEAYQIFGRPSDPFETVVVPVVNDEFLTNLHLELGCFPNVATYPDFRPHITIGRFKRGFWATLEHQLMPPLKQYIGVTGFRITGGEIE